MPAEVRRTVARRAPEGEGQARAGQPAAHRNESIARARFQTRERSGHYRHRPVPQRRAIDVVLAWLSPEAYAKAVDIARNLRREGIYVELPAKLMRAGDAVRYADRIGAFFTLMIGEDELKSGELTLKHMLRQEQIKITETSLVDHLKKHRELKEAQ